MNKKNSPRALITGLSSSLVYKCGKALISKGFEVVATTRKIDSKISIRQIEIDFTKPLDLKHDEFLSPFDFVFHGAAHLPTTENPKFSLVNVEAPLEFFSLIKLNPKCKFVFVSSVSVYGNTSNIIVTEDTVPYPENDYATSKLIFENYVRDVIIESGSNGHLLILRAPVILGRRVANNLISRWVNLSKEKKPIEVFNSKSKFSSVSGEDEIVQRSLIEIELESSERFITNCLTNGDLNFYEGAELISNFFGSVKPIIREVGKTNEQVIKNINSNWFNNISTRKTFNKFLTNFIEY